MKTLRHLIPVTIIALLAGVSCGIDDSPLAPAAPAEPTQLQVQVHIQPTDALRTVGTWNYWVTPVDVAFVATEGTLHEEEHDGDAHGSVSLGNGDQPVALLTRSSSSAEEAGNTLVGSIDLPQMSIRLEIEDGESLWQVEHDGESVEKHAEAGSQHLDIQIVETSTGHNGHGGATLSHCQVTLIAESPTDTFEIRLVPVQGEHGYRYESNWSMPYDVYDVHLEIEPPEFLRHEGKKHHWITDIDVSYPQFTFDSVFTSGTIGEYTWVGAEGDSLVATLRAGGVKIYGALGMGMLPPAGDETINFSVRLEDPTIQAELEPLFGSIVTVTVTNPETGQTLTQTLKPLYGHEGFHFGENMVLGLDDLGTETVHTDDGH